MKKKKTHEKKFINDKNRDAIIRSLQIATEETKKILQKNNEYYKVDYMKLLEPLGATF